MREANSPEWLVVVPDHQRTALLRLLATAPRSQEEEARRMLAAPPSPTDADDAKARAATVIRYLTVGYRVGDPHPAEE